MGMLARAVKMLTMEDPSQPLLPEQLLREFYGIGRSDAGVAVTVESAMRISTVYGCIKVISEDASSLPLYIHKRGSDGSVQVNREHKYWNLLCVQPSPLYDSVTWRAAMLVGALGWGNSYSWIQRDASGRPVALRILPPNRTAPKIEYETGVPFLVYETTATIDGTKRYLPSEDVIHLKGLSENGILGLSPIQVCKNAFGLALAAEKFGAQLFGNGARSSGVMKHAGVLSPEAHANLQKSLLDRLNGDNALSPLILEEGMDWEQISISPDDAQFIATRKFQRSEIACIFRVAMHLLQDLERATNNNIEHQSLDHIRYTLKPWLVKLEAAIQAKLFANDRDSFVEHDLNDFQRGDWQSLTTGLNTLRLNGTVTTNEVRRRVGFNPLTAEEGGNLVIVPSNSVPIEAMMKGPQPKALPDPSGPGSDPDASPPASRMPKFRDSMVVPMRDAVGRLSAREHLDEQTVKRALYAPVASIALQIFEQSDAKARRQDFDLEIARISSVATASLLEYADRRDVDAISKSIANEVFTYLALGAMEAA